ncbi:MAG: DUF1295 domain-containing protein [Erysipelotrichaceae bacterium]|nr:DUF1295 domain-containing protein [Erysipelotrichaceae bacterium]
MGWSYLGILFILSLIGCLPGFKKFVYFLSIGYGLSVALVGAGLIGMQLMGTLTGNILTYLLSIVLVGYGIRLSGFLIIREWKSAGYKKVFKEVAGKDKLPLPITLVMWPVLGVLYVSFCCPVYFRLYNNGGNTMLGWVGLVISIIGIALEAWADIQKSNQKAVRPDMVAKEGLYKMCRCPNYFGEILVWTGMLVGCLDILQGALQIVTVLIAWVSIVYIMFNGAQRLEKRQNARYKGMPEYDEYVNKTPIIIPFLPIYHLNKD